MSAFLIANYSNSIDCFSADAKIFIQLHSNLFSDSIFEVNASLFKINEGHDDDCNPNEGKRVWNYWVRRLNELTFFLIKTKLIVKHK